MQSLLMTTIRSIDMDAEILIFLCSVIGYCILNSFRHQVIKPKKKAGFQVNHDDRVTQGSSSDSDAEDRKARYSEIDKSLRDAFEAEDYQQVLKCWSALKQLRQCPPIHLSQIVKSMQCCNKDSHFIVAELRDFFRMNPKQRNISLINEILEPLARRLDDSQLVDLIVRMLPSINLAKDSRTYELLLTMQVGKGTISTAEYTVAKMRKEGIPFTPCALVALLNLSLRSSNIDEMLSTFSQLKSSWDIRTTWAVSPFALQGHKAKLLTQIVQLACRKGKFSQLLPSLREITVPKEVIEVLRTECTSFSKDELTTSLDLLSKVDRAPHEDSIVDMFTSCLQKTPSREASPDSPTSKVHRAPPGMAPRADGVPWRQ